MIGLKKDYEGTVKLINERLHSHQHAQQLSTVQPWLTNSSQHCPSSSNSSLWSLKPIGFIESVFSEKNGTPRQASICQETRATLTISQEVFTNPHHCLAGLELFSHIWILFLFHKNKGQFIGAKVRPPRLNGAKIGLFATRCPHRPNPVGLTLAQVEKIEGNVIYLFGVDMISGTPVIDIKPYIPQYDSPWNLKTNMRPREQQHGADDLAASLTEKSAVMNLPNVKGNICDNSEAEDLSSDVRLDTCEHTAKHQVSVANWIVNSQQPILSVVFTARAEEQLKQFDNSSLDANFKLRHLHNASELRSALCAVLQCDPRSVYRRQHCQDQLYYVTVDAAHVTCWFDTDTVEVLKVQSVLTLQNK